MARRNAAEDLLTHADDSLVTVTMDADVFRWLYDMLIQKHQQQKYASWIPHYQDQVARGYDSFRTAAGDEPIDLTPEKSEPVKSVRKAKAAPAPEPEVEPEKNGKKRVIRRVVKK